MTTPVNNYYGKEYSNLDYYIIFNIYIGGEILGDNIKCKKCGKISNICHAFSCVKNGLFNKRHNAICNIIGQNLKKANFKVTFRRKST